MQSENSTSSLGAASQVARDLHDPSLADLAKAVYSQRWLLLGLVFAGAILSAAIAFSLPRYYVSSTLVLPPQQQQSQLNGALAQLGNLASFAGAGATKSPEEMYVAFFYTRRLQDAIIQRFNLKEHYKEPSAEVAREILTSRATVSSDKKTGLINIEISDADSKTSAAMANAYVDEMQKILGSLAVTEAQQRRLFFDKQVENASADLAKAEARFKQAQARTGFVVPDAMAEFGIRESAQLRGLISAKEIALQALRQFSTEKHPEFKRGAAELVALRAQLQRVEQGGGDAAEAVEGSVASDLYRELKTRQAVLEQLVRQHEAAKIEESKDGPVLQQVDVAQVPERQTKPKRGSIIILGTAVSLVLAVAVAMARGLKRSQPTPKFG